MEETTSPYPYLISAVAIASNFKGLGKLVERLLPAIERKFGILVHGFSLTHVTSQSPSGNVTFKPAHYQLDVTFFRAGINEEQACKIRDFAYGFASAVMLEFEDTSAN